MDALWNNPLGWVQHQLLGGWRRSVVVGVIYLCIGMGILLFVTRVVPIGVGTRTSTKQFAGVALLILLGVQALLLVISGGGWVRRAVQRDFTSNMIDSHRLTPMTGWTAVFGYLIGPNLTFAPITAVNLMFSIGFSLWGGYPWWTWLIGLCIILCAAGAVASLSLLMALCTKGSANIVGLLVMGVVFGGSALMFLVPGLGLLVGGFSIINMIRASNAALTFDPGMLVAIAGQLALALIAGKAASRKYLRSDVQAFSWPLAMVMFCFVLTYGGLGLRMSVDYYSSSMRGDSFLGVGPKWVATLTVVTLFALLPLASVIQSRAVWQKHKLYYPEGAGREPMTCWPVLLIVLLAFVLIFRATLGNAILPKVMQGDAPHMLQRIGLTILVMIFALLPIMGILQVVYRVREKSSWYIAVWVVVAWAILPAIDLILAAYAEDMGAPQTPTWLMSCSPPGAWAIIWLRPEIAYMPGLVVQALLAVVMGVVLPRMRRNQPPVIAARPSP